MGLSALAFMLMHGYFQLVAFCLGLFFAYLFDRYRSLVVPIVVHVGWNFIVTLGQATNVFGYWNSSQDYHLFLTIFSLLGFLGIFLIRNIIQKPSYSSV
jgi:membrane protease YdiL (CAAX protease family)